MRDKIRADKRNIVVDLKPEGYQLVKLKEEILTYLSAGARQHLITAFWEYLIFLEVAYKILEKDQIPTVTITRCTISTLSSETHTSLRTSQLRVIFPSD